MNEQENKCAENHVRVACIQMYSDLGYIGTNSARAQDLIKTAVLEHGAKFVVLPEAAITGYVSQDLWECWHTPGRPMAKRPGTSVPFHSKMNLEEFAEFVPESLTVKKFCSLASELNVYIVLPFIEKELKPAEVPAAASFFQSESEWNFFNSCVLIDPSGNVVGHYRKNNLWGCVDNAWMTPARNSVICETPYGKVGLAICFDVHIMFARYAKEGIWTLLYPIAWVDNDADSWYDVDLPAKVKECGFNLVGANWSINDEQDGKDWYGYGFSRVISSSGEILSKATTKLGNEIIIADLPFRS
jgi:predicted amidohydrolase